MPLLYKGQLDEKSQLEAFCEDHLLEFWPYAEFALSLKIPQTFLLYERTDKGAWTSLSLGRVISGSAELFFIFVHPDHRRQGLAAQMLKIFEKHAASHFLAESVYLEVRKSNAGAIGLYEQLGYLRIAERKRYYSDGEDALIYQKLGIKA